MAEVRSGSGAGELTQGIDMELERPELRDLGARLHSAGVNGCDAATLLGEVHSAGRAVRIGALKAQLSLPPRDTAVERWLLLHAMKASMPRLSVLPVPGTVKQLLLEEFAYMIRPDEGSLHYFQAHRPRFAAMAKQALLRRFPAGLFQWEESGIPRRWLLRIPWRDLPRAARMMAGELGGLSPLLVPHLNARRKSPWLTETAANRSYFLMAEALETQPHVRGIAGASWFRAPGIVEIAPHLAWVNRVFLENGGFVTTVGPADASSGVFANNPQRRALYDEGRFKPMLGLALWPRDAVLTWKRAHPEFAPGATPARR
jgi:hypothetical protein